MPVLIIKGDLEHAGDLLEGVELWRTDFLGWDLPHRFLAETWCVPRRYLVIEAGEILAAGATYAALLNPGELYHLAVEEQPPRL